MKKPEEPKKPIMLCVEPHKQYTSTKSLKTKHDRQDNWLGGEEYGTDPFYPYNFYPGDGDIDEQWYGYLRNYAFNLSELIKEFGDRAEEIWVGCFFDDCGHVILHIYEEELIDNNHYDDEVNCYESAKCIYERELARYEEAQATYKKRLKRYYELLKSDTEQRLRELNREED